MTPTHFTKIKDYLLELDFNIIREDEEEGVFVIANQEKAITNTVLVLADPLVIIEQYLCDVDPSQPDVYQKLLIKNRDIIHGAFVLDQSGSKLIFKNTHELENLDMNELEATFNSLSVLLSEYSAQLIAYSIN